MKSSVYRGLDSGEYKPLTEITIRRLRNGNVKAPQWLAGALDREDGRELQSRLQLLQGGLSRLVEKLAVGVAEFLEVGLAVLHTQRLGEVQVWLSDICHRSGLSGGKKRAPGTFPSTGATLLCSISYSPEENRARVRPV